MDQEKETHTALNIRKYSFLTMVGSALTFTITPFHYYGMLSMVPFITAVTGGVSLFGIVVGACAYGDIKLANKKLYEEICTAYSTSQSKPKVESTVIVVDIQSDLAKTLTQSIKDGKADNQQ
jgi:hypothetical protein